MASIVRDLQARTRAGSGPRQPTAASPEPAAAALDQEPEGANAHVANGANGETANGGGDAAKGQPVAGLWVLGGATTVLDFNCQDGKAKDGGPQLTVVQSAEASQEPLPDAHVEPVAAQEGKEVKEGKEGKEEVVITTQQDEASSDGSRRKHRVRSCLHGTWDSCKEVADIVRLYPLTFLTPVLLFFLLVGLGIWGVIAGARSHVQQRKDDARSRAVDAATGFQIQLQQSFTPGVTVTLLVKQRPEFEFWFENFNSTAEELLSRVPLGALYNIQLQPFAQVIMIYPLRTGDLNQIFPARNLLGDPGRRADILRMIATRQPVFVGPFTLGDGSIGAFVRYPIFVPDVGPEETWGFRFRENASALSYNELPSVVRECTICYNATSREKWWGVLSALVNYDAVTQGEDAYLANLRKMRFDYALVRPVNSTYEQVIAQVGPSSLRDEDAVTVEVKVVDTVWLLRVAPEDGFEPPWRAPLIAAVVIIALIMSLLLFVALASYRRQRLLLQETVAANHNLAETTKRLKEEKERMDVLLVRQYDLLRCLDANRSDGKVDSSDAVSTSKRAMMARIEDARRSLNVAKASAEDPIQVFELLGAGAFGKVQRGLWRGTVVAVKTMILPANMTGQQKREKMAVMEAAISSSLVHPNIVTTYTYFIRPYHEPAHSGVQHMLTGQSGTGPSSTAKSSDTPTSMTDSAADSTIHSYEVRLVLEFCDKGSLKDALEQHAFMQGGALNLPAMLETAADVAKAMVHMHAANVLHSDLKARNIMLKSSGTEGRGIMAKVADFGLSTRMEHQETHLSSCFQGTLTHMAPEVMLEGRISKAADVYSFGILMWELFCASDPFTGVPRAHLGHAITKEGRRPKFPSFAPQSYVQLATRCWDPDASLRPTFEEVLTELGRMREELGGDTPALVIMPPRPLTSPSGTSENTNNNNNLGFNVGGKMATGGPTTLMGAGIVVGGASTTDNVQSGVGQQHRSSIKSALAQRHLRKLGIRVGSGSSSMAFTLPALHEEAEHKEV